MELKPDLILRAYAVGIFPMAESRDDGEIHWIDPHHRGVLPLDRVHVPRRLRRTVRSGRYEIRADTAFREVIAGCAQPAEDRHDTWINPTIERLYVELHQMGFAHSIEAWHEGKLVGGLYGVALGAAFFGESMFSLARDASKVALVDLVVRLRLGGYTLLDTQFLTRHLAHFGAVEVPRAAFRRQLATALARQAQFPASLPEGAVEAFLQSTTQTS